MELVKTDALDTNRFERTADALKKDGITLRTLEELNEVWICISPKQTLDV